MYVYWLVCAITSVWGSEIFVQSVGLRMELCEEHLGWLCILAT